MGVGRLFTYRYMYKIPVHSKHSVGSGPTLGDGGAGKHSPS